MCARRKRILNYFQETRTPMACVVYKLMILRAQYCVSAAILMYIIFRRPLLVILMKFSSVLARKSLYIHETIFSILKGKVKCTRCISVLFI